MAVTTKELLRIAQNEGDEIFLLFGRSAAAYIHIGVNGECVCKQAASPYSWTSDFELTKFQNERWYLRGMRIIGRISGIPNLCPTCSDWFKFRNSTDRRHEYIIKKRRHAIRWGCQVCVDKIQTTVKRAFLDMTKTIKISAEFCSKPTLDPNFPICLDHSKMWKNVEKLLDHDTVQLVQQFAGVRVTG